MNIDALPTPKAPNLEESDANQLRLRTEPPRSKTFDRAYSVIAETPSEPTPFQKQDLAEAYAAVGRFTDASQVGTAQSDFYRQIEEAIWRDDAERCECPTFTTMNQGVKITVGTWFTLREIFSTRHGKTMPLKKCSACDSLNVFE